MAIKDLVSQIYPLHRTLASDGTDEALRLIGKSLPPNTEYSIEAYVPGSPAWTWRVPERYVVQEAYLETVDGTRWVDWVDNPLHLVSYSLPVNQELTWEELQPHLFFSPQRPHAVPWVFKYYERSWGFCLSKDKFDVLPRDARYRAVIRSEFVTDPAQGLRVGVALVKPEGEVSAAQGEILISSHVCHPNQANDDATGVAVAVELAGRLKRRPLPSGSMAVRFVFGPETIGTICYLSRHEDLIPEMKGSIFIEMPGNKNVIALQRSRQDDHLIDRIARRVLQDKVTEFREGAFRDVIRNDEYVINGPGVNIPCISLSRWPYEEYHTSDDNLDIIHEEMLCEAADIIEEIIRVFGTNYVPYRRFRGPVFLSGYGLHVDQKVNRELNRAIEKIMLRFEGVHSVFDIAEELHLPYWSVREQIEKFRSKGLINVKSIPGVSGDQLERQTSSLG